jgi:hypothetical protein
MRVNCVLLISADGCRLGAAPDADRGDVERGRPATC